MTAPGKATAPNDLDPRGKKFWQQTVEVFELSEVEMQLLRECCRLLDECESLREHVDREGVTVAGSTGQVRVHPALGELRQHRLALGRLLAQMALPDLDDSVLNSPVQARARKAAETRWRAHNERKSSSG